jgi:RNA polymerase sigma-70 factor (ECF subfamily)
VLASLVGFLGDFELAEEAAAEAFAIAAERWPRDGTPANPAGWLLATARNRAIDRIRRARTLAARTRELALSEGTADCYEEPNSIPDERLELISPAATGRWRSRRRSRSRCARWADWRRPRSRAPSWSARRR